MKFLKGTKQIWLIGITKAKKFKADVIVRVTGDCPLIDVNILDEMVENFFLISFILF